MSSTNDDDEEEIIIYAEFNGMLHEDILHEPNVAFKIIGYDSEHPIMQIGDEIYEGEYEDAMGTNVIFEEDTTPNTTDEVFAKEVPKRVQYLCKTNKILKMNRIFIAEKNPPSTSTSSEPAKFAETYDEALTKLSECYLNQNNGGSSSSNSSTSKTKDKTK